MSPELLDQRHHRAMRYVGRIRNAAKRQYALECCRALLQGSGVPDAPTGLSCMAAQAVRMELRTILGSDFGGSDDA